MDIFIDRVAGINSRPLGTFPSKMNPTLYGQSKSQPDNDMLKGAFGGIIKI